PPATAAPPAMAASPATPPSSPSEAAPSDGKPEAKLLASTPTHAPPAAPPAAGKDDEKKTADALKAEGAQAAEAKLAEASKPGVIPATIFLNVTPWGEVYVNGRSQGVSPPKKVLKLDPGKY